MKPFRMRYYLMAPLLVLAMIACAKRDSDFAKKAAEQKAAAEAAKKPGAAQPKPGDAKAGTNDGKVDVPESSRGGTPSTGTDKPADSKKSDSDTKEIDPEQKKKTPKEHEGDLHTEDSCDNKISMKLGDKEEKLSYDDIVKNEEGTYVLQDTQLFIEKKTESEKTTQLNMIGLPLELADGKDDAKSDKHLNFVCNTVKESSQKIEGDVTLPYDISTKDGSIKHLRIDNVSVSKTEQKTNSRIYKHASKSYNLKMVLALDSGNNQVSIVKAKDSKDIILKIQFKETKDQETITKTYQGTYSLKK